MRASHRAKPQHLPFSDPCTAVERFDSVVSVLVRVVRNTRHFLSVRQGQYANNRVEVSHEHAREQERQMQGFRSDGHAQRLLSVHGQFNNLLRLGRSLLRAPNHRELRDNAFQTWVQASCAQ